MNFAPTQKESRMMHESVNLLDLNAPFLARIGLGTAENGPPENLVCKMHVW
jgi:hypothetical protein